MAEITQAIYEDERYVPETNSQVLAKLEKWQDLKFGLLMHWGAYCQWGIVESWSLCPEDYDWCRRTKGSNPQDYETYRQEYEALPEQFNPTKFNPEKWADAAAKAGMKYVVFTTKHHDGFCMYDSQYTDYKITNPNYPFSKNENRDITKEIFESFRKEGLWTGVYFSKPDWNSPLYWNPNLPIKDRNVNYEPAENPKEWQKFTDFTHNQILELLGNYGKIDILWLDGGWVAKTSQQEVDDWKKQQAESLAKGVYMHSMVNQDIKMDQLVEKARKIQSDLIVVDRAVYGKNQNYLTPENRVPDKPLPYPWESCIISGGGWTHTRDAKYMSGREAIQMLVDIVVKGGNLLLNIAPTPEGEWQPGAYRLLKEFEEWMKVNSEAIYNSRLLEPYKKGKICYARQRNEVFNFFYLADAGETQIPKEIFIPDFMPVSIAKVKLLGCDEELEWELGCDGIKVFIPEAVRNNPPCDYVWTIQVKE